MAAFFERKNMEKRHKNWLYIGLGMFAVPEILWSPILGILPFNKNYISNDDNHLSLIYITLFQFIGLIIVMINIYKSKNLKYKKILMLLISLLSLWSFFIFYILFATLHMGA